MRTAFIVAMVGLFAALPTSAAAQSSHDGHHPAAAAVSAAAAKSEGTVRKVDKTAGKVTIAHGPLTNLNMPAMTMAFRVSDVGMLDRVKAGDKIRFTAERPDGMFTVTTLELAK